VDGRDFGASTSVPAHGGHPFYRPPPSREKRP